MRRPARIGAQPVDFELVEERIAIRQYLGGYAKDEAERLGRRDAEEWRSLVVPTEDA